MPLQTSQLDFLDFTDRGDSKVGFREKIKAFCNQFGLGQDEEEKIKLEEELYSMGGLNSQAIVKEPIEIYYTSGIELNQKQNLP
ncbi:MAG TPA: hypothetical protein PLS50_09375 [Candidatus Dojkabacteria bacterium]|nr:hypothetical protein [Candidatus Dojkabacteria bacterium]